MSYTLTTDFLFSWLIITSSVFHIPITDYFTNKLFSSESDEKICSSSDDIDLKLSKERLL